MIKAGRDVIKGRKGVMEIFSCTIDFQEEYRKLGSEQNQRQSLAVKSPTQVKALPNDLMICLI